MAAARIPSALTCLHVNNLINGLQLVVKAVYMPLIRNLRYTIFVFTLSLFSLYHSLQKF